MDVETGDFQDWEVLHNSDSDSVEDMKDLEGIEGESEGIIRADYFSLDSQSKYLRTSGKGDVTEEGSVDSDNPSWIDPGSVTRSPRTELGGFWSDSGSDGSEERKFGEFEGKNELGFVENAKGQVGSDGAEEILGRELGFLETAKTQLSFDGIEAEGNNSGKFWSYSSEIEGFEEEIERCIGDNPNSGDGLMEGGDKTSDDGDVVMGTMKSGSEGEKRIMVWWKLPPELLKYCLFRISPVWTFSMAVAVMSFVILGRRYYRMMKKSRSLQLNVTMDDKKVSQFMSRVARLNEAFSVVTEDWDLQAIVRGCSDDHSKNIQNYRDDFLFNFPDVYEANNINNNSVFVDELDDIYKPFYPIYNSFSTQAHIVTPSNSFPEEVNLEPEEIEKVLDKEIVVDQSAKTVAHAAKYKRRKNQNKKVMVEATAEGLSSDLWAWRKYGQKPIKGSPYPRSYYRCSSSKGCLARKQVEQSCTDPGMFIINYSGEHNHSQPTRRSSLAGTNRHKFFVPKKMTSSSDSCTAATTKEESSCSPPSDIVMLSPTTPLMPSIEEVLTLQQSIKNENSTIGEEINNDVEFVIPDIMINDDFFVGLEELDGLISDSVFYTCSTQQFQ